MELSKDTRNRIMALIANDVTKEEASKILSEEQLTYWDEVYPDIRQLLDSGYHLDIELDFGFGDDQKFNQSPDTKKSIETTKLKKLDIKTKRIDKRIALRKQAQSELGQVLRNNFERQKRATMSKFGATKSSEVKKGLSFYDKERYIKELTADLEPAIRKSAIKAAETVGGWDSNNATNWFKAVSDSVSWAVSDAIDRELYLADKEAQADGASSEEALNQVFDDQIDGADWLAIGLATTVVVFGLIESAKANNVGQKTWITTSDKPRSSHAELNGMTIAMNEDFPNGAAFPGSPDLPDEERINCQCMVDFEGV